MYINEDGELNLYSDYGRILNPLVIVHYDKNGYPYTKFDKDNVDYILSGKADIEWYLE